MATNVLAGIPPELLGRVLRSGQQGAEEQALRRRLLRGQELQQQSMGSYTNPWAAALGGLAGVVRSGRGAYEEQQAQEALDALGQQQSDGQQALFEAYQGGMRQQQVTAPDVIAPSIGMPDATPEQQAMASALRSQQQRDTEEGLREGVGQLGLLSGNPALRDFSNALLRQDTSDLQAQRLEQSGERLRLLSEGDKRRAELAERKLSLMEEQAKSRRENADVRSAEKKTADALKLEGDLRKEVMGNPITRAYLEAQVAYEKVQRAAKDPSAAGDLALIFGVMKTLDPGSTVREGEFANAQNAGGVDDRVVSLYNRVIAGQRLSPDQRADFVRTAATQFAAQQAGFQRIVDAYRGVAQRAGVNVADVLPLGAGSMPPESSAPARATPAAGNIDLNAPAAPAITTQELRDAEAWLRGNPNHADAPAVRARLEALRAGGNQ